MHRPRGENFEAQDKVRATSDRLKIRWPSPLILCLGEFTIASVQPYSHPCRTWCVKFLKFFFKLQPLELFYMKHIKCWEVSNNCPVTTRLFPAFKMFSQGSEWGHIHSENILSAWKSAPVGLKQVRQYKERLNVRKFGSPNELERCHFDEGLSGWLNNKCILRHSR